MRKSIIVSLVLLMLGCLLAIPATSCAGINQWTSIGPDGGPVSPIVIDTTNPATIYAGTVGRLYKSTDGGGSWKTAFTSLTSDYVKSVAIDPSDSSIIYLHIAGKLYKSTDGAKTWSVISTQLPGSSSLLIIPNIPATLYALYGGRGIYKSTDSGLTWNYIYLDSVRALAVDPTNPSIIYAGTDYGVYKSMNGGETWSNLGLRMVYSLAIDPSNPTTLYAGTWFSGVFKSTNGGVSWSSSGLSNVDLLVIDSANPATIYAETYGGSLFKSTDGGGTWSAINNGMSCTQVYSLAIDPAGPNTLYVGTNRGAFKTTNGGGVWYDVNIGHTATSVTSLIIDPTNSSIIYASTDLGVLKSANSGGTWYKTGLNYGGPVAIEPVNTSILYGGTWQGVYKSTNAGLDWSPTGLSGTSVTDLVIDTVTPSTIYASTYFGVFKSINSGISWDIINSNVPSSLAIDPTNPDIIYVGTMSNGLYKSSNGGGAWESVNTGLNNLSVQTLAIDPTNPTTIYAGTERGVFKSTNGGASWNMINTSLTNIRIMTIAIDPTNPTTIYAGTFGDGVFKSTDGGETWFDMNAGLTNTIILSFAFVPTNPSILYVGTYGGGAYTYTVPGPASSVTVTPDKDSPRTVGTQVTFTAAASGGSGSYQYQFWLCNPAGTWSIVKPYSATPTWTWNTAGLPAGNYMVQVWAKNTGSSASYEAFNTASFTLTWPPASSVTLTPDKNAPRPVGTSVTFTAAASGGSGSYQYQFWVKNPGGSWTISQAYSTTPSWTWSTTGLPTGTYNIQVWARNAGSSANYEVYKNISYALTVAPVSSVTLTPSQGSPRPVGTAITFTANASGGSGSYQYQFFLRNTSGTWSIVRSYGATSTWTWDTAGLPVGTYNIQVWAKNTGSTASYEAYRTISYILSTPPPASSVTLTPDKGAPQPVGTGITFTAAASGGSGAYQYQFWVKNPVSGSWSVTQAYGSSSSWTWNTAGLSAGTYGIQVWAKNNGSTASYEAYKTISYALVPVLNITATPGSPQPRGTSVTCNAAVAGGSGTYLYQFFWRNPSTGAWTVGQAYSTNSSWTWNTTTGLPTGSYSIQVWAKKSGSTAAYDYYKSLSYVLQ